MQTFLPYPSFESSAKCLDQRRLGKQRVEAWQILRALRGETNGWISHPATKMWRGYEDALAHYGVSVCFEWLRRGHSDSLLEKFLPFASDDAMLPHWFGDEAFHASHRSNLLRKMPEHYGRFGWSEPNDFPYVWP